MIPAMSETLVDDPVAGFAGLMNKAAEQAAGPAAEAPFGYTTDPDGTVRPKKAPGRPRKQPTLEELKAARDAAAEADTDAGRPGDRAPDMKRRRTRFRGSATAGGAEDKPKPVVQFREGVIAKGVNRLYRKAGKLIKVADADIGQALIDITRKDTLDDGTPDPEDVTVGEAWEELARANPRIRAFLMRILAGGAWGQLLACHAPVLLAVLMKDAIRKRIPFMKLLEAFLAEDTEPGGDGSAPADGTPLEGLQMPDMQQMMAMTRLVAQQAMNGRAPGPVPRPPEAVVPDPPAQGPPARAGITAVPAASGS
jgi:hypothetical protein